MKRYLCRILACLTLCATLSGVFVPAAAAAEFEDVPETHWAAASIRECVELGFFNGETATRFGVGHQMTRSAFAVVLCRFFGWETSVPAQTIYSDIAADAWYAGAIRAAYDHGAITGQRTEFRPADPITREELAVTLVRALGYGTLAGLGQDLESPFRDVTTNAGYIATAYHLGLVSGTSADTFSPTRPASREQVAVILMRLYSKLHKNTPETLAVINAPEDVAGADVALIPALRIVSSKLAAAMQPEAASAAFEAARKAELPALLYVEGSGHTLSSIDATKEALIAAVNEGNYDGLFLNLSQLASKHKIPMVKLARKLDEALGDKTFYLAAEAPARNGKNYKGYDYAALAAAADRLVLHIAPYADAGTPIPISPPAPPEEIHYAFGTLTDIAAEGKLSVMFSTDPSSWAEKKQINLSDEDLAALLANEDTSVHYSPRYQASYLLSATNSGKPQTTWYLESKDIAARIQLASLLGARSVCVTE